MGLFSLFNKNKETIINSPVNGFVVGLDKVPDNIFSSGMMGKGLGFVSNDAKIYSPCNGKVVMAASTKHAIGIDANGVEILIHVGMDTCELNGEGLKTLVKVGDKVLYSKYGGTEVTVDGEEVLIARADDIFAVFE